LVNILGYKIEGVLKFIYIFINFITNQALFFVYFCMIGLINSWAGVDFMGCRSWIGWHGWASHDRGFDGLDGLRMVLISACLLGFYGLPI
jgi:hypothetical protein